MGRSDAALFAPPTTAPPALAAAPDVDVALAAAAPRLRSATAPAERDRAHPPPLYLRNSILRV